ncbi:MAG TPA: ABC transporter substrate-binding protein [Acidimicrobiales bacterium]|jgi:ABC-type branched-subunit amino acid transport system substrate-binding protein
MQHLTRSTTRSAGIATAVLLAAGLLASCSNSNPTASSSTTTTAAASTSSTSGGPAGSTIVVGAISTLTGSIAADFDAFSPGMQAYFQMVNAAGGINGHKFAFSQNLDDGSNPSQFTQLTHTLLDQDHVFAVGVSTFFFNPALYAQSGTPTFGYNVSGNWNGPSNLFAAGGSVQDYDAGAGAVAWLVKQTKSSSVAFISYGSAITSSYNACNASANNLRKAGIKVSYTDLSEGLGGNYTPAVQKMQQTGTDFVVSCMQSSDNITLTRAIQQYGLKVHQLWLNGYDQSLLSQYSSLMQGVYINVNGNVPFQVTTAFPGVYPGMQAYLTAMQRYQPNFVSSDQALQGWQSAALLGAGVQAAGANVTQANVIAQINKLTNFTAGGLSAPVDWTKLHTTQTFPACSADVVVKGSKFVPVAATGHQVFECFAQNVNLKNPVLVTPPAGTPGT